MCISSSTIILKHGLSVLDYYYYPLNMQLFIIYSLKKHYEEVKQCADLLKIKSEIKHHSKNVQAIFYSPIHRTGYILYVFTIYQCYSCCHFPSFSSLGTLTWLLGRFMHLTGPGNDLATIGWYTGIITYFSTIA